MTKKEFKTAIGVLSEGCGEPFTAEKLDVWYACLGDLTEASLRNSVMRFLIEDGRFPSIAKLRKLAAEYECGWIPSPSEAFDSVMTAVRLYGFYRARDGMSSLDELTGAAVRCVGGWNRFCDSHVDQRGTLLAQFRDAYNAMASQESQRRVLPDHLKPRIDGNRTEPTPHVRKLTQGIGNPLESS